MEMLQSIWQHFSNGITQLLPLSPFRGLVNYVQGIDEQLGWLNWFVPVGGMLGILGAWLIAVGGFYALSIVLRWIKAISG